MDILNIARQSGMTVVLDARIGQVEYHSVHGSVDALQKLIDTVAESLSNISGTRTINLVDAGRKEPNA